MFGLNKNAKNPITEFIKHTGLNSESNKLALALMEKSKNKTYNLSSYPYRLFWQFILGNFYSLYHYI